MTNNQLIEELVTKECERYELEKNGFITDRQSVVRELVSQAGILSGHCSPEEFLEWKEQLLNGWYARRGFAKFFYRKSEKPCMFGMVKRLLQNAVSGLRKVQTEMTLDDELKIEEGRTVAFKLSSAFFERFYKKTCCNGALFVSPGQLETACIVELSPLFPLKYPLLYERLAAKDNEFWEEIWRLIHRFVRFLVVDMKGREDAETIKEVSMETVLSFQEQLERGKMEQITSARHLLNSLQMTGRNKFREWLRAENRKGEEILLTEEDWVQVELAKEDRIEAGAYGMNGRFDYLLEIDEKNEYEVCCALVDVLSCGSGRVYEELVDGREELAQAMLMLYVENKQYEEIGRILYNTLDASKLANLRKSVSRGKEYLKKQMADLIRIYKRKGKVPFVTESEEHENGEEV